MKILGLLILSYILGAIPTGLWIGKLFFHANLKQKGSKNTGTTNSYRVLGKLAGTLVMIIDVMKGYLATAIPSWFGIKGWHVLIFGVVAVIGNTFSIFNHFNGGKAVATSEGMLLFYNIYLGLTIALIELILILITSMVSLSSMISFVFAIILALCLHDIPLFLVAIFLTILVFYRHHSNINRIKNGEENLVHFGYYYTHKSKKKT